MLSRGNLYISHSDTTGFTGTKVRKIFVNGDISESVSSLNGSLGTNFDSKGNMYVVNDNTGEISKTPPQEKRLYLLI